MFEIWDLVVFPGAYPPGPGHIESGTFEAVYKDSERIVLTFTTAWALVSVVVGTAVWWVGEHPGAPDVQPTPLRQYVFLVGVALVVPFGLGAAAKGIKRRHRRRPT